MLIDEKEGELGMTNTIVGAEHGRLRLAATMRNPKRKNVMWYGVVKSHARSSWITDEDIKIILHNKNIEGNICYISKHH